LLPFPTSHSGRGIVPSPYTGAGPHGRSNMDSQGSPYTASGRHLPTKSSSSSSSSGSFPPANYVVANFPHIAPSSVLSPILPEGDTAERHLGFHACERYRTKLPEYDYSEWYARSMDNLDRYDGSPLSPAQPLLCLLMLNG
jgi:hypothetical protein